MGDDESEKLQVKKISLVKRKCSDDNPNYINNNKKHSNEKDIINLQILESKLNLNGQNNDLKDMNFDEAQNYLDNKLSNLIDKDNEPNKNILDDEESDRD